MSKDQIDSRNRDNIKNHEERAVTAESVRRHRQQMKNGPLAVPAHFLESGKHYYLAREDEMDHVQNLGYKIVYNKDIQVGDESATKGHHLGSTVSCTLGKDKDGRPQKGILMEITEELWQVNQEVERDKVRAVQEDVGKPKDGMSSVIFNQQ
jgi:hypothetical protein